MSKTLVEFKKFDIANPQFWEAFQSLTLSAIDRGRTRYSARTIWEVMRWHTTIDSGAQFKCEDCWIPFYSRKFMTVFPQHDGFFSTKAVNYSFSGESTSSSPQFGPGASDH